MPSLTLTQFQSTAVALYQEKRYAEALAYVSEYGCHFPDVRSRFRSFEATMAALTGQTDLAITCLKTALDAGEWFREQFLRNPELASLQGLPAFEALVVTCRERHKAARAEARPQLFNERPEQLRFPAPLLLVMHGNNGNGPDTLKQWQPAVEEGYLLAVAQSSQVEGNEQYVWNDMATTDREMVQHLADLRKANPIDDRRIALGGFSMGGGDAIRLAVSGLIPARGFIAVAPYVRDLEGLKAQVAQLKPGTLRGYIITGDKDFSYSHALAMVNAFREAGIPCEIEDHPGLGHFLPDGFDQSLQRALAFVTGQ